MGCKGSVTSCDPPVYHLRPKYRDFAPPQPSRFKALYRNASRRSAGRSIREWGWKDEDGTTREGGFLEESPSSESQPQFREKGAAFLNAWVGGNHLGKVLSPAERPGRTCGRACEHWALSWGSYRRPRNTVEEPPGRLRTRARVRGIEVFPVHIFA